MMSFKLGMTQEEAEQVETEDLVPQDKLILAVAVEEHIPTHKLEVLEVQAS